MPTLTLNTGAPIPQLGFGTYKISDSDVEAAVRTAVEAGYRSIDTAAVYGNEAGVGRGVRSCGVPREDLFVTSKVWNDRHGRDATLRAFDESLDRLGLDAVDLYLVHWPVPEQDLYVQTWQALQEVHAEGRARAIGVSNFRVLDLERLIAETDVVPAVNQVELHPGLPQDELRAFHAEHGITTEAWSPLARTAVFDDLAVQRASEAHGRTPAQVVLRWHLQLGHVVIPKSATPERIRENIDVFDFTLSDDEVDALTGIGAVGRTGPDPDTFGG